ncbi:helix-hairpin-helix domain-containing protein [Natrinema sp. DC36]|uniref:helix-hairpin-helix domain-containing protein n=1 Tax=Natrinema sp. DC36 TaxID=2878680 RepID=UPI001CF00BC5|nr:helix-hairpin-helix domain-containing protein [Natrinema sp. DC36]
MTEDLTDIDGIGPTIAKALEEAGFETVDDVPVIARVYRKSRRRDVLDCTHQRSKYLFGVYSEFQERGNYIPIDC